MKQFKTLKDVFDHHAEAEFDDVFARQVILYFQKYITKNDVHISFFGSSLLGVHKVRYNPTDMFAWLEDLLLIDDIREAQKDVHDIEGIEKRRKVSSDLTNLSFCYVLHRLHIAPIDPKLREQARRACLMMSMIKYLTSGQVHRFKYPADELIAVAMVESLDNKTDLKSAGSWLEMLYKKADTFLREEGVHRNAMERFDDTIEVVKFTNDVSGRIISSLNLLTERYHAIRDAGMGFSSSSVLGKMDGEVVLKDYISKPRKLVEDMERVTRDPNSFVKEVLMEHTLAMVSTCSATNLNLTLKYFTENFIAKQSHQSVQEQIVVYVITLGRKSDISLSSIPLLMDHLRKLFRASRVKQKEVLRIKTELHDIVSNVLPDGRDSTIASVQVALVLYIALRALTIKSDL